MALANQTDLIMDFINQTDFTEFPNQTDLMDFSNQTDYFGNFTSNLDLLKPRPRRPVLVCPSVPVEDLPWYNNFSFWTEGVTGCIISILGILFNSLAIFVLSDKDMVNSFNMMLTLLCGIDSAYLFCAILESFRKSFDMATNLHTIIFSWFLYPVHTMLMTASIYLTVGITFERYTAVHHPVDYNQAMNDVSASRKRVAKFAIPTLIACILINIPKFFESKLLYFPGKNGRPDEVYLTVSDLRANEYYATYYSSYGRNVFIGFIPFILLTYFNYKIYKDIQARNARRYTRSAHQVKLVNENAAVTNNNGCGNDHNTRSGRRMMEDNLAKVFGFIVGVFMVCHTPRLLLGIHEAWITSNVVACNAANKRAFPMWAEMFGHISHVMMAINSSVNGIIYGFISPQFRKALKKIAIRWGCMKKPRNVPVPLLAFPANRNSRNQAVQVNSARAADAQEVTATPCTIETSRFVSRGSVPTVVYKHGEVQIEGWDKECESLPMIIVHQVCDQPRLSTWPRVTRV